MIEYEGKFIRVVKRNNWEFVERKNATGIVAIVAVTNDNNLVLIKQYREPVQKFVIEIPAGLVGDTDRNETIETAARRELMEETGYHAKKIEEIGTFAISPGVSTELLTYVVATDLEKQGEGEGDGTEQIESFELPVATVAVQLLEMANQGDVLVDAKIFASLTFAFLVVAERIRASK